MSIQKSLTVRSLIADRVGCGRNVERNQESKRKLEVENTVRQFKNSETCITLVNLWIKPTFSRLFCIFFIFYNPVIEGLTAIQVFLSKSQIEEIVDEAKFLFIAQSGLTPDIPHFSYTRKKHKALTQRRFPPFSNERCVYRLDSQVFKQVEYLACILQF